MARAIATATVSLALSTAVIYPLKRVAPVSSLSVVYLPAVLVMSIVWGLAAGLITAVLSAIAFNFLQVPPVFHLMIADSGNMVALLTYAVVAAIASALAEVTRSRTEEGLRRRDEADLAAAIAQDMLAGTDTPSALPTVAHRIASVFDLQSATIELSVPVQLRDHGDLRRLALGLHAADGHQIATLWVPRSIPADSLARLRQRVLPTLQALLVVARQRDALLADEVQTQALRRSDEVKTALLRAVSHDLRTPLTAIVATGHALASDSLEDGERRELAESVIDEGSRLADLVQKLLDLSRLQAGSAEPHLEWVSVEELVVAARDTLGLAPERLRTSIPIDLPEFRADAVQLERVLVNLLQNAERYARDAPISINATATTRQLRISVTDQGDGIPSAELDRIFEPFYRGPTASSGGAVGGSGLGLSIARGFTECNGGTLSARSLPGQGTTFTLAFPL